MARIAAREGIRATIATPHQLGKYEQNAGEDLRRRTQQLVEFLEREEISLRVLPGADVRIAPELVYTIQQGDVLTLAGQGKHVLLELPHELYFSLNPLLKELDRAGMTGILSHPERNRGLLSQRDLLLELVDAGCLMQITAGSITGTFGRPSQELAAWMLHHGLVHFVATDAHGAKTRRPLMRRAFDQIVASCGLPTAVELLCRNPARVVDGLPVLAGRQNPKRSGRLFAWTTAS